MRMRFLVAASAVEGVVMTLLVDGCFMIKDKQPQTHYPRLCQSAPQIGYPRSFVISERLRSASRGFIWQAAIFLCG